MTPVQTLAGKQIVIAVTGSIAAVETVKLIHAFRRKGAMVQPVMSPAAAGILHPDALTYASGRETITRLSGLVEHVGFCGDGGCADLLLIAPCTANTIGKIACGIDDTTVTTFATTAIGSGKPVVIVPAMHHSMYRHPGVVENIAKIKKWGIVVVDPLIDEEKAKMAGTEENLLSRHSASEARLRSCTATGFPALRISTLRPPLRWVTRSWLSSKMPVRTYISALRQSPTSPPGK